MFVLSDQELRNLRSQFATSSLKWGGQRIPPFAFTEQGIAMLSTVLNSDRAIGVNITIMRAFVQMRRVLISNKEFEMKLNELEAKYDHHDQQFKVVFDALRKLMSLQAVPRKRIVGLEREDD